MDMIIRIIGLKFFVVVLGMVVVVIYVIVFVYWFFLFFDYIWFFEMSYILLELLVLCNFFCDSLVW